MEIGKKIRELRMRKGLTQEELAKQYCITQAAVSQRLQRILRKLREELGER